MTEPKKFKKGHRTYTKWGPHYREVRIEGKQTGKPSDHRPQQSSKPVSIHVDAQTETGVYSNMTMVHGSDNDVILDFIFLPPHSDKGRVRSRVILSPHNVDKVIDLLRETSAQLKK